MSKGTVVITALLFATFGLALQIGIMSLLGFEWGPMETDWVISATLGLYIGTVTVSLLAAGILVKETTSKSSSIRVGCIVSWLALVIEGLVGTSSQFLTRSHEQHWALDYVGKPMFWIIFVGTIPALVLGMIFGYTIWTRNHKSL